MRLTSLRMYMMIPMMKNHKKKKEKDNPDGAVKSRNLKNRSNSSILHITYAVTAVFVLLIAYFMYFVFVQSQSVIGNTYNPRLDLFSERIIRGDIRTSDGVNAAETVTGSDSTETRRYPYGDLFCHLTGYSTRGKTGLESLANFYLLSSHINLIEQAQNEIFGVKSPGDDIVLTVSYELQKAAYDALGDRRGAVMALDPETGRVLCMVSKPGFDPNTINEDWESLSSEENDAGQLLNRATQGAYPPGSIFKIFTVLEYIHEHPYDYESFSYTCDGSYEDADGNVIRCFGNEAHGEQNLYEAFANSCNGAFAMIGREADTESMKGLCDSLLFNSRLPIDLPYSRSKYTLSAGDSNFVKELTGIGQGNTLVSPAHMLMITSAIANDGILMRPMLIESIESAGGETVRSFEPEEYGRLMDASDSQKLREMMRLVVTEGTGSAFRDAPYESYIKTGSAEYENGEKTHAWCLSFVDASGENTPSGIAVAVIVEDGRSGGSTAAPVARQVTDAYFSFLKN